MVMCKSIRYIRPLCWSVTRYGVIYRPIFLKKVAYKLASAVKNCPKSCPNFGLLLQVKTLAKVSQKYANLVTL